MWVGVGRVGVLSLFSAFFSLLSMTRHSPLYESLNQASFACDERVALCYPRFSNVELAYRVGLAILRAFRYSLFSLSPLYLLAVCIPTMQLNEINPPPGTPLIPTRFSGSMLLPSLLGEGEWEMKEFG